jgi:hypothetical protein
MELSRYLKKGHNSAARDCTIFKCWEDRKISTRKAIELFKISNSIRPDIDITPNEFTGFLNSLGYYRGN